MWVSVCGCFLFFFFFFFGLLRATPVAYGGSQARGLIGAVAASLRHSHSNARSEPRLQPTLQLMATPDPRPTEQGQGSNLCLHGYQSYSFPLSHNGNSQSYYFLKISSTAATPASSMSANTPDAILLLAFGTCCSLFLEQVSLISTKVAYLPPSSLCSNGSSKGSPGLPAFGCIHSAPQPYSPCPVFFSIAVLTLQNTLQLMRHYAIYLFICLLLLCCYRLNSNFQWDVE